MKVNVLVNYGDQQIEVTLTPETYDLVQGEDVVSTVGPTIKELVEQACSKAIAALEAGE